VLAQFVLFDGFDPLDVIAPFEVLDAARLVTDGGPTLDDDGDLISGASVTSGLDLGLYLVERELGPRIAHAVEKLFAHERRGTVWRDAGRTPTVAR